MTQIPPPGPQTPPGYIASVVYRPAPGDPKLGRQSLTIALVVLAASLIVSMLVGLFLTETTTYSGQGQSGFHSNPNQAVALLHFLVGTAGGVFALVQGIRATSQNRGRRLGVAAIVIASAAPILSLICWGITALLAYLAAG